MAFLTWDDSFSVGVQEIDNQHKKLIEMLNQFYEHVAADNKKALAELLKAMGEYTVYHFQTEEKYFDRFQFAEAPAHKQKHKDFIAKVNDVATRFNAGKMVISIELTNFIKDWVVNHVKNEDKHYQACFNSHGLH